MFDNLSTALQRTFKNLRGQGSISEKNINDAMREIRLSLLEADVHFQVVKDFIKEVKEACMGEEVLNSVTPGQQITKRVHDKMVELLGSSHTGFSLNAKPAMIMMIGLQGAGKTTTCGKLAVRWKKEGKKVLLVACDIKRPAAVQQLEILAEQSGSEIFIPQPGESVPMLGLRARDYAIKNWFDIVIFDTAGRLQIDTDLVDELKQLQSNINPQNTVLVIDSAIGQESVNVAESFNNAVGLSGLILTKMDGDARGGAALSVQKITGCPVHLVGTGEKQEDLEDFHPDRIANRILGMGDVVSLVEKAQVNIDEDAAAKMQERMFAKDFNYNDFLMQFQQMKKLGNMEDMMDMVPGIPKMNAEQKSKMAAHSGRQAKKFEAIIQSMTKDERIRPGLLNASRKKRLARGSGTQVRDINELMKSFDQARKMGKNLKKYQNKLLKFMK